MTPQIDREQLGRLVFRTMQELAPDAETLRAPWEEQPEDVREADRRIGEAVANAVLEAAMGVRVPSDTERRVEVQSGYGANSREPFVTLSLPGPETRIQLRAAEAFDLGTNLIQGAEAALTDGVIVDFFHDRIGLAMGEVGALLTQLRAFRIRKSREGT